MDTENSRPGLIFARNLRNLRTERGLSQEAFGDKSGSHRVEINKFESGRGNPTLAILTRLRKALECTWEELLGA